MFKKNIDTRFQALDYEYSMEIHRKKIANMKSTSLYSYRTMSVPKHTNFQQGEKNRQVTKDNIKLVNKIQELMKRKNKLFNNNKHMDKIETNKKLHQQHQKVLLRPITQENDRFFKKLTNIKGQMNHDEFIKHEQEHFQLRKQLNVKFKDYEFQNNKSILNNTLNVNLNNLSTLRNSNLGYVPSEQIDIQVKTLIPKVEDQVEISPKTYSLMEKLVFNVSDVSIGQENFTCEMSQINNNMVICLVSNTNDTIIHLLILSKQIGQTVLQKYDYDYQYIFKHLCFDKYDKLSSTLKEIFDSNFVSMCSVEKVNRSVKKKENPLDAMNKAAGQLLSAEQKSPEKVFKPKRNDTRNDNSNYDHSKLKTKTFGSNYSSLNNNLSNKKKQ